MGENYNAHKMLQSLVPSLKCDYRGKSRDQFVRNFLQQPHRIECFLYYIYPFFLIIVFKNNTEILNKTDHQDTIIVEKNRDHIIIMVCFIFVGITIIIMLGFHEVFSTLVTDLQYL